MHIVARVTNSPNAHAVHLATDGTPHQLTIAPKPTGAGSSVNGGELLFLALATCYCNDLYREAAARGIAVHAVEVEVRGAFGGRGDPASDMWTSGGRASVGCAAQPAFHAGGLGRVANPHAP